MGQQQPLTYQLLLKLKWFSSSPSLASTSIGSDCSSGGFWSQTDPSESLTPLRLGSMPVCTHIYKMCLKHIYIPICSHIVFSDHLVSKLFLLMKIDNPSTVSALSYLDLKTQARGISRQQTVSEAQQYSSFVLCQEYFPFGEPKVAGLAL